MDERPPLPTCVRRVLKACRKLPWAARALLLEIFELDLGPEGCWLSAGELGERLGTSTSTIEKYLARFEELRLLERVKRRGVRTPGWHLVLPRDCVPLLERPRIEQVRACRNALEAYLAAHQPGRGSGLKPDPTAVSPPRGTGTPSLIRPESLPVSAERGGDEGGAPAAGPLGNAKIQLPLPATAAGAGADAQEPQRESSGRLDVGRIRRMAATEPRARLPFTDARARGDA